MSGHSKFANIKHKKEKNDAAKGKIFTIIGRELAVAVKEGGCLIRQTTAGCVTSSQRQRPTICRMIRSTVVSRRQPARLRKCQLRVCYLRRIRTGRNCNYRRCAD